jgi:hypothetical protein
VSPLPPAPFGEPELHYWRRRGNRRVRKVRRIRSLLRHWPVVVANLAGAVFVVLLGIRAVSLLMSSEAFALEAIVVEGTHRTTPARVEAHLRDFVGESLLVLDLAAVASRSTQDPWVESATVKRVFPDVLRITVTERTPAALALLDGLVHVVDDAGRLVGPVGPALAEDHPVITGITASNEGDRRAALERGAAVVRHLRESCPSMVEDTSELDLSADDVVVLTPRTPGPRILLDPELPSRNVLAYLDRRPDIEARVGHARWVDLRWRGRIVVSPEPPNERGSE